jgi:hypothetical protein
LPIAFQRCSPALIDPVLHQDDIRIVEHFSGGFKADFVLRYIRFCLRRIPLELPAKTIHVTKLYQRRNDFVGVTGRAPQPVIAIRNMEQHPVEVTVEDSGPGIDPDKIGRIFQRFSFGNPAAWAWTIDLPLQRSESWRPVVGCG